MLLERLAGEGFAQLFQQGQTFPKVKSLSWKKKKHQVLSGVEYVRALRTEQGCFYPCCPSPRGPFEGRPRHPRTLMTDQLPLLPVED